MRFALAESASGGGGGTGAGSSLAREETWDALTIVGTCERLEKSYFRLTSAPDPATVRPRAVLEKALARLKRGDGDGSDRSSKPPFAYRYATDQLKAIRQDLTVQRLRDGFAAEVYEHHARLALRNGDLGEFNQCQTVLAALYDELRAKEASKAAVAVAAGSSPGGGADPDPSSSDPDPSSFASDGFRPFAHETEFLAYRVLYAAATRTSGAESTSALARACRLRADPAVAHALAARAALESGDAVDWFRLRAAARRFTPLGRALMETRDDDVRFRHVSVLAKTVRPTVPVRHLAKILGFSDEEEEEDLLSRDDDRAGEEGEEKEDARKRDAAAPRGGGFVLGRGDGAARRTPPEPSAGTSPRASRGWRRAGRCSCGRRGTAARTAATRERRRGGAGMGFFWRWTRARRRRRCSCPRTKTPSRTETRRSTSRTSSRKPPRRGSRAAAVEGTSARLSERGEWEIKQTFPSGKNVRCDETSRGFGARRVTVFSAREARVGPSPRRVD